MLQHLRQLGVPLFVTHYARGVPFRSMMDLDAAEQRRVLQAGEVANAARYSDPAYVPSRRAVEAELHARFVRAGGRPRRARPHYALVGRSARIEARQPRPRPYVLPMECLPADQVSFTWGDSFCFDPAFREARCTDHPASGELYAWPRLPDVVRRWQDSTGRAAWQELEVQLWFDPPPEHYSRAVDRGG